MNAFQEKLKVIQNMLMGSGLPENYSDLDESECIFLASQLNVRFKKTSSGFMCFYSSRPGLSGLGVNRCQAFIYMLNNLGFKFDPSSDFLEQLETFFEELT